MDAMLTTANDAGHTDNLKRRPSRRWRLVAAGLVIVLLIGICGYLYCRPAVPQLPTVVLQEVDPAVVVVIEEAHHAVRGSPHSAAAWGRLGMVLLAHDFFSEANKCLS